MRRILHIGHWIGLALLSVLVVSCELFELSPSPKGWPSDAEFGEAAENHPSREVSAPTRKVLLVFSAGYNSLYSYLREDLLDLQKGYVPGPGVSEDILLVLSHLCSKFRDYNTPVEPVLYRLTRGHDGNVKSDTLLRLPHGAITTKETVSEVLTYIKDQFPAASYGMIFTSHASGWLPPGYYSYPEDKYSEGISWNSPSRRRSYGSPVQATWPEDEEGPAVKSIGQEQIGSFSHEMSLRDFASAFPMHFDYILVDACLMGGVEVAYEFKDICDGIGFSQAEVLAEGFNYKTLTHHLLENKVPDPVSVCSDYFNFYDVQSGIYRSATISYVDCNKLDPLVAVCKTLFEKYRTDLAAVNPAKVQNFGRRLNGYSHSWYFDLKDVLVKAGASDEDLAEVQTALDYCILYKAATPVLLGTIPINAFSGLTIHLPAYGTDYLNTYYKENVSWNDVTELVK